MFENYVKAWKGQIENERLLPKPFDRFKNLPGFEMTVKVFLFFRRRLFLRNYRI